MKKLSKPLQRAIYGLAAAVTIAATYWALRPSDRESGPKEGAPAPAFQMIDLSGQKVTLSQYRGKVVLLDFWATWCDACREELPNLKKIHADLHPQGFELLAASVDESGRKALVPFVAQNDIPWRVLLADPDSAGAYSVYALPAKFLIDQNGVLAKKYTGWVDPNDLENDIKQLLSKKT